MGNMAFDWNAKWEAIAHIEFYNLKDGGMKQPYPFDNMRCPLMFEPETRVGHDIVLQNDLSDPIKAGDKRGCKMIFAWPEILRPLLSVGAHFYLWNGRTIAEGKITNLK